jgi:hypothetical protein
VKISVPKIDRLSWPSQQKQKVGSGGSNWHALRLALGTRPQTDRTANNSPRKPITSAPPAKNSPNFERPRSGETIAAQRVAAIEQLQNTPTSSAPKKKKIKFYEEQ